MSFRFLPDQPVAVLRMPAGQAVLLDPAARGSRASCLEVLEGIARVYCPCEETEGMTLAFLQPGDQLRTDRLCSEGSAWRRSRRWCSAAMRSPWLATASIR